MKTLVTSVGFIAATFSLLAQGTLVFDNNIPGSVVAPVYDAELSDPNVVIQGNTVDGTPPGTAVYSGMPLTGSGWTAQLWAALGADRLEDDLAAVSGSEVPFSTDPGFIQAPGELLTLPGIDEGMIATLQLRVWDNNGGQVTSFDQAIKEDGLRGVSKLFNSQPLGGVAPGPNMVGLESFNVNMHVPEPSTFVLGAVALGAAWMFCRRKE